MIGEIGADLFRAECKMGFAAHARCLRGPRGGHNLEGGYQFSWVEVLLFTAAIVAMAEQVKVAKPGINNTAEVFLIGTIAVIQLLLFALAAAKVLVLGLFDSTEFLLLTLINLAQTAVAHQINASTLMRTISSS
jgi:hypothetical protein